MIARAMATASSIITLCAAGSVFGEELSPSDFITPEYLRNWGLQYTFAADAYALGFTGRGVKIGIADSAVQLSHPEFAGRVFWPEPEPPFPAPGYPDFPLHGTNVTGIAAAGRNGFGMMGVAFDASIANVVATADPGYPLSADWSQELVDAGVSVMNASFGPRAAPMETSPHYEKVDFEFYYLDDITYKIQSVRQLAENDVVMVFSAGNNRIDQPDASVVPDAFGTIPLLTPENTALGYTDDPSDAIYRIYNQPADDQNPNTWEGNQVPQSQLASYDFSDLAGALIAVTAVDINEKTNEVSLTGFSNECGIAADWCIAAPGLQIYSAFPMDTYGDMSGTSQAAPFVAGSAAVLRQAFPYMTARQINEVLLTNATQVGEEDSVKKYGHGLVNVGQAVKGPIWFWRPSLIEGNESIFPEIFAVNTDGHDSVWSNNIRGSGGFSKAGAGRLTLTGQNTYTGDTTITGGILRVDGSIASSDLIVAEGATLEGTGSVGTTVLNGTLSPGNSVGTLTVEGDLTLGSGSRYVFEVDAGQNADRVVVNGTTTIAGGALFELDAADGIILDRTYPMFEAGSIVGSFENLHTNYTFIDLDFNNTGTDLEMVAERNAVSMVGFAETGNQRAVARAIDAQVSGAEPYNDVILNDDRSQLSDWYQAWSGEVYSASQAALLAGGRMIGQMVNWRLNDSWLAGEQAGRLQSVGETAQGTTFWAQGYGNRGRFSANADALKATADTSGILIAADRPVGPGLRVGAGFATDSTKTKVASSRANTSAHHALVYATHESDGLRVNGALTQSWNESDVSRTIAVDDQGDARSTVDSRATRIFAELSLPQLLKAGVTLSPFVRFDQSWLHTRGFTETGAEAALSGRAVDSEVGFGTVGARWVREWQADDDAAVWQASVSAGWQHAWGDRSPETRLSFETGPEFRVKAAPIAEDAALLELGIGARAGERSRFSLAYSNTYADQSHNQMLQARLQWWY